MISEMGHADVTPLEEWGHDSMWLDSLHHALHVAPTDERDGYYGAFDGSLGRVAAELGRPAGVRLGACAHVDEQRRALVLRRGRVTLRADFRDLTLELEA